MGLTSRTVLLFACSIIAVVTVGEVFLENFPLQDVFQRGVKKLQSSERLSPSFDETVVPLEQMGGVWIARVEFNDLHPAKLIVDTGATFTTISEDLAFDAGIQHVSGNSRVNLFTAGGKVQAEMGVAKKIRIGNAGRSDVRIVIHTIPNLPEGIDGLLGLSFFDRFLVNLDQSTRTLHLTPKS